MSRQRTRGFSRRFGPGMLVAAAFVGPGTVTTATLAGARFGFDLLWALLFSVIATIVLQGMSARLGLVTRMGLGEALKTTFAHPILRAGTAVLVVSAIGIGNCAYQTGNITGAAMGLGILCGGDDSLWALLLGGAAFVMLARGRYRSIERALILLVGMMGLVFLATAVLGRPGPTEIALGLLIPAVPQGSLVTIVALIGTTVVPYNLFLHASAVREKWAQDVPLSQSLSEARRESAAAIALGGIISLSIVATAAVFYTAGTVIDNPAQLAEQLRPLLGPVAQYFFAAGLLAAGLTSAVTAPLAAAYATAGVLGWSSDMQNARFRVVWATVVVVGTVLAVLGRRPVAAILFAQAANGLLLPIVAVFLLIAVNQRRLLGRHVNGVISNVLGGAVVLIVSGLGAVKLKGVAAQLLG